MLRPEVVMDTLEEFVADVAREVEVDVRQRMQFLVEEAVEVEVVLYRVDVREPDEVADDRRHRRAASPRDRPFVRPKAARTPVEFVRDLARKLQQLPVDKEKACEPVLLDQHQFALQAPAGLRPMLIADTQRRTCR